MVILYPSCGGMCPDMSGLTVAVFNLIIEVFREYKLNLCSFILDTKHNLVIVILQTFSIHHLKSSCNFALDGIFLCSVLAKIAYLKWLKIFLLFKDHYLLLCEALYVVLCKHY